MGLLEPLFYVVWGLAAAVSAARRWWLGRISSEAAAALGAKTVGGWTPQIHGQIDGFSYVVVPADALSGNGHAEIDVIGPFDRLTLRLTRVISWDEPQDVLVGDPTFDSAVVVQGNEAQAIAGLNATARARSLPLVERSIDLQVEGRRLSARFRGTFRWSEMKTILPEVIAFAKALPTGTSLPERLAGNALHDPVSGVRLRNLEALIADFAVSAQSQDTCRAALGDRNPWVRLQAARGLGTDGLDALAALAQRSYLHEAVAHEALEDFLTHASPTAIVDVCTPILSSGRGEVLRRAVEMLGELRHQPALEGLVRILARPDSASGEAAARALGQLGGPTAEKALLDALEHPENGVRIASARALGEIGTVEAVSGLRAISDESSSGLLRRTARESILKIQSRLVGAAAGQLSLSDDASRGQVSLVEPGSAEGRVSLADSDARKAQP